jgi:acyl-CoA thioesterase
MSDSNRALKIARHMLDHDAFSRLLGVEIVEAEPGRSVLRLQVRNEMVNGFGVLHGGVTFALADSALAFAAGSHGRVSLALDNKITFVKTANSGDTITATAEEEHLGRQIGVYNISVRNQEDQTVALMRGTVFRTNKNFETSTNSTET